jgi:glycosyltransferase involved in cell wall biosynthesis
MADTVDGGGLVTSPVVGPSLREREVAPRVLHVVHTFLPDSQTGTEIHTYELALALKAGGHAEVAVFHPRYAGRVGLVEDEVAGIPVFRALHADPLRPDENPAVEAAFGEVLEAVRPDLVHFQHCAWGGEGLPARAAALGVPSVMTLHDYWGICPRFTLYVEAGHNCRGPDESGRRCLETCWLAAPPRALRRRAVYLLDRLTGGRLPARGPLAGLERGRRYSASWIGRPARMRALYRWPRYLIAPSAHVRSRYLAYGLGSDRIRHIPHGIQVGWAEGVRRVPAERVRFGFIGTPLPHKGLHVLLEAFSGLTPGEAELVIYADLERPGNEYAAALAARAREVPGVRLAGGFTREELARVFGAIDVLVVPSIWEEAFGLVVLEARAAGAAVVVSDAGGLPELVRDGVDGLVAPAGDAQALRAALRRFVEDPGLAARMAAEAPAPRTIAECAADTAAVYRAALGVGAG